MRRVIEVDLAQGHVRVLEGQLPGATAVGLHVGDQLDHLGDALLVQGDVLKRF